MLRLIGSLKTRAFRVAWMLEELGLEYDHVPAAPGSDEARAARAPGKVPVLEVDGQIIWDSVAITTYLADRAAKFTHPAGSVERARQDAMTCQILDEIEAPLWMAARHSFILPEKLRVPEVKDSLRKEFADSVARLDAEVSGDYLAGDTPSVPDFLLTHCLNWAKNAKFEGEAPSLQSVAARMRERPAYQKLIQLRG
ncbi:MAG: glutathione S-transferase family protein [Pseudomonadota bacterium]